MPRDLLSRLGGASDMSCGVVASLEELVRTIFDGLHHDLDVTISISIR